jgi:hypothetical protein
MNEEAATTGCQDCQQEQCYGYGQHRPPANWLPSLSTGIEGELTTIADERIFCSRSNHFYSPCRDIAASASRPSSQLADPAKLALSSLLYSAWI